MQDSFYQAINWLDTCGRHGITLNPEKFVFGHETVTFAGFEITADSVRPCRRYLDAIRDFPMPNNITDIRSWFGLINQVSYAFASTKRMLPFRQLLKPNTPFTWNNELSDLFEKSKAMIIKEIEEGVRIFDQSLTHLPRDRLVQIRYWFLAPTKTLQLSFNDTILLSLWLENYASGKSLHPCR